MLEQNCSEYTKIQALCSGFYHGCCIKNLVVQPPPPSEIAGNLQYTVKYKFSVRIISACYLLKFFSDFIFKRREGEL